MIWLSPLAIGGFRLWLGRGVDWWPQGWPGRAWTQYAVLLALMFLIVSPWPIALTHGLFILLLARGAGHTPLLYAPGAMPATASLKGLEGWLWTGSGANWYVFGALRYVLPAAVWQGALLAQGVTAHVALASIVMLAAYRIASIWGLVWAAEICWAVYGVAIALGR